jgi:hypothetical protein
MKRCRKCGQEKDEDEFSYKAGGMGGRCAVCKPCERERKRVSRSKPEHSRREQSYHQRRLAEDPMYYKKVRLKNCFGITLQQHQAMYAAQDGCCALCKSPVPYDRIDTDHDHTTGKVRGLLCHRCNMLMGFLDTSKELLYDAFRYMGL